MKVIQHEMLIAKLNHWQLLNSSLCFYQQYIKSNMKSSKGLRKFYMTLLLDNMLYIYLLLHKDIPSDYEHSQ